MAAVRFWREFIGLEQFIARDMKWNVRLALKGLELIKERCGLTLTICVNVSGYLGLPERKNSYMMMLSAGWDVTKVPEVEEVYRARTSVELPSYWRVTKYYPALPHRLAEQGHERVRAKLVNDRLMLVKKEAIDDASALMLLNDAVGEWMMMLHGPIKVAELKGAIPLDRMTDVYPQLKTDECLRCGVSRSNAELTSCCDGAWFCSRMCRKNDPHRFTCEGSL